ncbi:hypothetical protein G4H71_14350 [Rhodococcus triatomae]|uniref:DUF2273 domain-containing protein n=1 Tax=Rhodococcus triatomae TaxID=300028 RepID=A0A1G8NLH0_9NOCA|nr:hypothetical protein [Rhodococcus triatomae]QNG20036.1 hypothetical protein G4H72_16025 [Rhodococcus triatomae]QNG24048.1 hypothetical protein G4H71_14350 [Rhodococcus triatomae]SDI81141.1 hypothetical protein SAMN05444695_111106 [Rhodococcus triatomae]
MRRTTDTSGGNLQLLGVAGATGGLTGFLLALVLGVVGYLVGGHRDGEIDLAMLFRGRGRG